jgi:hypothetical protein
MRPLHPGAASDAADLTSTAFALSGWQHRAEDAAAADLALDRNLAPIGGDDAVTDGEAETGSGDDGLGGEEGVEDARQDARRNA